MKFLLTLFALTSPIHAFAATDDDVYSLLDQNGAFVHCTSTTAGCTNTIELLSLQCYRRDHTSDAQCSFVDIARPLETQNLNAAAAAQMLDALLQGAVPSIHAFGERLVNAKNLRCEKDFGGPAKCEVLKPLFGK